MYNLAAIHECSLAAGVIYVNICLGNNKSLAKALRRKGAKKSLFFHHPLRWRHRGHRVLKEEAGVPGENYQPFSVLSVPPW